MTKNCLTDDQLAALLQNESLEDVPSSWARHLEGCSTCHRRLERMSGDADWMSTISTTGSRPSQPSANLDRVMRELKISAPTGTGEQQVPLSLPAHFLEPPDRAGMIGRFGPYEIIETIASGGMGIVFKALDPTLNRVVAIKVLPPMLAAHESARERFVREARAAAAVSHLHVVTIHAVDEAKGLPYLVMQFVSGRSLDKRIAQTGPLRVEEILRIGMQMAAGLAAAHAQGLVHRDIKPGNVLLENGIERVKLTDFGLARAVDEPALTQTGYIAGTPEYMSPEQANGERVDHRSDLFSLGSVLYAMSTGKSPFHAGSTLRVMRKVCDEAPPPVHEVNPAIPRELSDVIAQLMEKETERRFQTAREVEEVLGEQLSRTQLPGADIERTLAATKRRAGHTGTQRSRAAPDFSPRYLRPVSILLMIFLAVGTGFMIWLVTRDKNLRTDEPAFVLLSQ